MQSRCKPRDLLTIASTLSQQGVVTAVLGCATGDAPMMKTADVSFATSKCVSQVSLCFDVDM